MSQCLCVNRSPQEIVSALEVIANVIPRPLGTSNVERTKDELKLIGMALNALGWVQHDLDASLIFEDFLERLKREEESTAGTSSAQSGAMTRRRSKGRSRQSGRRN